ncbi:phosphate butyryltransferase [Ruminococcaceae bacterium OttesenSCG-928-O06]|nr:phosphate butyryltransferase [Ruminococcaceae bacterium OttesenSCG-928-O06]
MLKSLDQMNEMLRQNPTKSRMGVVAAHDEHTLQAVSAAVRDGLVEPVLYGFADKTAEIWKAVADGLPMPEIVACDDVQECVAKAMLAVNQGQLQCVMKGILDTAIIMKGVVNSETGIRASDTLSSFALLESPYYHKLFGLTDPGIVIQPTLQQKVGIINNAVEAMHKLGVETPKVAVLSAMEHVNPKMPDSVEAAELKKMNQEGLITGCIVEGPISYDIAMNAEAAQIKGFDSPVAGDADIVIMPEISAGNIAVKALMDTGGAISAGTALGAKVPLVLASRGSSARDKYLSIVLSALVGPKA